MRNPTKNTAALAFSVLLSVASPISAMDWQAGMKPSSLRGSFFSTCSECSVDSNGYLKCRCVNNAGRVARQSSVALGYCNRVGPNNSNGFLNCQAILRGSWKQSCAGGTVYANELWATCRRVDGQYQENKFNLNNCQTMNLTNVNGRLQCED